MKLRRMGWLERRRLERKWKREYAANSQPLVLWHEPGVLDIARGALAEIATRECHPPPKYPSCGWVHADGSVQPHSHPGCVARHALERMDKP